MKDDNVPSWAILAAKIMGSEPKRANTKTDLTGSSFGSVNVLSMSSYDDKKKARYYGYCSKAGKVTSIRADNLISGKTTSNVNSVKPVMVSDVLGVCSDGKGKFFSRVNMLGKRWVLRSYDVSGQPSVSKFNTVEEAEQVMVEFNERYHGLELHIAVAEHYLGAIAHDKSVMGAPKQIIKMLNKKLSEIKNVKKSRAV